MSLFSSFTKTFQKKPFTKSPVENTTVHTSSTDTQEITEMIAVAKQKAEDILKASKEEAKLLSEKSKEELDALRVQYDELKSEFDKKQKGTQIQESIINKKQQSIDKLETLLKQTQKSIDDVQDDLFSQLMKKVDIDEKTAKDTLMDQLTQEIDNDAHKTLHYIEEETKELAETKAQEALVQVMKHGSTNYVSEYTPPVVLFDSSDEEQRICGKNDEHLRLIEQLSTVEITHDEEMHQLKLYCFNTIQREMARVLLERLKRGGLVNQDKIRRLYQQTQQDLQKEMLDAGRYLCNQLRIYNLPQELVQTLGMFKFRYSYGQNMIIHTLEEAKIGIALSHELGADSNIVRLGCLFHDIGKVVYDDTNNHVESGVKLLKKFNMPESVIACVAESHEDIPFSSIESMIVHVADSISGARPGARFDDYEGFLKHQQGLIDISMSHKGVTEAFVINGGREVRVMVDPQAVNDEELDMIATSIRDQVQEFSTYPGSIVINLVREFQHSELKD